MKHMWRKPLLPAALLAILVFGGCFLALFQKSIEDDLREVDGLYANTRLVFQVVPGEESDVLRLDTFTGDQIRALEEVSGSCVMMQCRASVRVPAPMPGAVEVYGTNDPDALAQAKEFGIAYGPGYDGTPFARLDVETVPCILSAALCEELGVTAGDTLVIAGSEYADEDPEKAPGLTVTLAGTYWGGLTERGIIVPNDLFLAKPGLLYNSNMMWDCFYRYFTVDIDPAYNREHQRVRELVEEELAYTGTELLTNVRALEQTVGPMERKLELQQLVVKPLTWLLWIASGVVALLLGLSFQLEVFLRLMWGEKRGAVFFKLLASVCLLLVLSGAAGLGAVWLMAGSGWLSWAAGYLAAAMGLCVVTAMLPLAVFCRRNLIQFYQSREG